MKVQTLSYYVQDFLQCFLQSQKGYSRHTILNYRDTIKLLLIFAADSKKKNIIDLKIEDFTPDLIIKFLSHIEKQRQNSTVTRNNRLACIHSFFNYLARLEPLLFDQCYRISIIPFKRISTPQLVYLEREEIKSILSAIRFDQPDGLRDYALFQLMYNTGARVQELIDLPVKSLQFERPFQVRFFGKGRKERLCPLWPQTVKAVNGLIKQRKLYPNSDALIFVNHCGNPLTRYGVRYLLAKYVRIASENNVSLNKKSIHPHTIRHATAMHLLQSGVDINTIRIWLGHVDLKTTNRYAEINMEMKRNVLQKYVAITKNVSRPWKKSNLLEWLEAL